MKEGYFVNSVGHPDEEQLKKINKLCRRDFSPEELFVFTVVLCDNEIDRDNERFSVNALQGLSKLFVGKTGICDHSCSTHDQFARIFECYVEELPSQTTKTGEAYNRLVAKAYMPDCESNRDLIMQIDAGIKKEVSIGCAFDGAYCSICGQNVKTGACRHRKGKTYETDGKKQVCYHLFDNPADAYEWSFVAIPAQPKAGVIKKSFKSKGENEKIMTISEIKKSLKTEDSVCFSAKEAMALLEQIEGLEQRAKSGEAYMVRLKKEVARLFNISDPETGLDFYSSVVEKLNVSELEALQKSLTKKAEALKPAMPQLAGEKEPQKNDCMDNYII